MWIRFILHEVSSLNPNSEKNPENSYVFILLHIYYRVLKYYIDAMSHRFAICIAESLKAKSFWSQTNDISRPLIFISMFNWNIYGAWTLTFENVDDSSFLYIILKVLISKVNAFWWMYESNSSIYIAWKLDAFETFKNS